MVVVAMVACPQYSLRGKGSSSPPGEGRTELHELGSEQIVDHGIPGEVIVEEGMSAP